MAAKSTGKKAKPKFLAIGGPKDGEMIEYKWGGPYLRFNTSSKPDNVWAKVNGKRKIVGYSHPSSVLVHESYWEEPPNE